MAIKRFCDKCKKEIVGYHTIQFYNTLNEGILVAEVCDECFKLTCSSIFTEGQIEEQEVYWGPPPLPPLLSAHPDYNEEKCNGR